MRAKLFYPLLFFFCISIPSWLIAQSDIRIDGYFEDWENIPVAVEDFGDQPDGTDLLQLKVANDREHLYFYLQVNTEILWQEQNQIRLYVDTDKDSSTGIKINGIGAEITFTFGERSGQLIHQMDTIPLEYQHLGLIGAPSMYTDQFEWALSREVQTEAGIKPLAGRSFRLVMINEANGDAIPDQQGYLYKAKRSSRYRVPAIDLELTDPGHLRLVSHNVNKRHFHPEKKDAFTRIYQALAPDFLLLEEAYEGTAEEILDYFRPALGDSRSVQWYAYKAGAEATVLLSPYPANEVIPLGNSAAYLLRLPGKAKTQLALIALSMPCCRQDSARQAEADQIMAFVKDLRTPGGEFDLPPRTPIILAGDANLVGFQQQYYTLLTGAIQDNALYGPAFAPDWDETDLMDLHPKHLQRPSSYTWRGNSFFPGRLDYFFYTDSVLKVARHFVFDTVDLPKATLDRYQLKETDAPNTYKHLPLVMDMILEQ